MDLPPKAARQIRSLLDDSFLERTDNVLVFGNPGIGRTHILQAIGQELIRRGHRMLFITCEMLVQELQIAKRDLKLSRLITKSNANLCRRAGDSHVARYLADDSRLTYSVRSKDSGPEKCRSGALFPGEAGNHSLKRLRAWDIAGLDLLAECGFTSHSTR